MKRYWRVYAICLSFVAALGAAAFGGPSQDSDLERFLEQSRQWSADMESRGLASPFTGLTTNGEVVPGLFEIRSTGVSTAPVQEAADRFLGTLSAEQRRGTVFAENDDEWRKWANQHIYYRDGISFEEMTGQQRDAAFSMLGTSLSAKGLDLTRDIMRLNETLGELNNNNFVEYGEWKYWISIMGEPSATEPWGLAVGRSSPEPELFRHGRPGRDDSGLLGFRTRRRNIGQVCRHVDHDRRTGQRTGHDPRSDAEPAAGRDP